MMYGLRNNTYGPEVHHLFYTLSLNKLKHVSNTNVVVIVNVAVIVACGFTIAGLQVIIELFHLVNVEHFPTTLSNSFVITV